MTTIHASTAHARGGNGGGIVVAVIDTGLDVDHREFIGRIAAGGYDFMNSTTAMSDASQHGTHVSGIIAANRNLTGMHGVAYGAKILPLRIADNAGAFSGGDTVYAAAFDRAVAFGARVMNNSYATTIYYDPPPCTNCARKYNAKTVNTESVASFQDDRPLFLESARNAVDAGVAMVFQVGDQTSGKDARNQPGRYAGLPWLFPELEDLWVAVIAVDINSLGDSEAVSFTGYTHQCGVAADWCITAPGGNYIKGIQSTVPGGTLRKYGTSMAAAHVSGALAVLMDLFPSLTTKQIIARMFASATKTGVYADPTVGGQGLLNLGDASAPLGLLTIAGSGPTPGYKYAMEESKIVLGAAFGDALQKYFAELTLAVEDSFDGAVFYQNASMFVDVRPAELGAAEALRSLRPAPVRATTRLGNWGDELAPVVFSEQRVPGEQMGFQIHTADGTAYGIEYGVHEEARLGFSHPRITGQFNDGFATVRGLPHLSLAGAGVQASIGHATGSGAEFQTTALFGETEEGAKAVGMLFERAFGYGDTALVGDLGLLFEQETVLGAATSGAFEVSAATPTLFSGVSAAHRLSDKWQLVGGAHVGVTRPVPAPGSLLIGVSPLLSGSATIGALATSVAIEGDQFGMLLTQPLRVERGTATLSVPTGLSQSGTLEREEVQASLTPSGRELDLEMVYSFSPGRGVTVSSSLIGRFAPGHVAEAPPEAIFATQLSLSF